MRRVGLLLTACFMASCAAQTPASKAHEPLDYLPALAGDYFPLKSAGTGTTYHIYNRYPEGYAEHPKDRYPIVYLLDGDSALPLLAPEHLFIHYDDKVPDAIMVGIAYGSFEPSVNHRHFDYSPPSGKPGDGGAPAFERFLREQVIPAVESRSRADSGGASSSASRAAAASSSIPPSPIPTCSGRGSPAARR